MIGKNLADLRKRTGLSQADFAAILGITRSALSHYEQNRRTPDLKMAARIKNRFKISFDELLKGVEEA